MAFFSLKKCWLSCVGSSSQEQGNQHAPIEKGSNNILSNFKVGPKLLVEQLDTENTYEIDPMGLKNSQRPEKDGRVYGGKGLLDESGKIWNDVDIDNEGGPGERYFVIGYEEGLKKYTIKDLDRGSGTFVRISGEISIRHNYIISFGECHMNWKLHGQSLQLKIMDKNKQDISKIFDRDQRILIGRLQDCSLIFDDSSMSRYQCELTYKDGWFLTDGYAGKSSTNGTWLFVDQPYNLHDDLIFKTGNKLFKANIVE